MRFGLQFRLYREFVLVAGIGWTASQSVFPKVCSASLKMLLEKKIPQFSMFARIKNSVSLLEITELIGIAKASLFGKQHQYVPEN